MQTQQMHLEPTPDSAPKDLGKQVCPHCSSELWVRVPRSFFQKIIHFKKILCFCRNCRKKFWRPDEI